ncbi:hypothetical protein [Cetobacterium sp. SF1]|uniref:hypothetical protein n=1 Tax=unclassified Cetobacterium TaxID=2630983 RepID=UPI003CE9EC43
MGYQKSYSSIFNKYWDFYRRDVNVADGNSMAENIQQVKNMFSQTIMKMLLEIDPELDINQNDIQYVSTATLQGMPDDSNSVKDTIKNLFDHPYNFVVSSKLFRDPKFIDMVEHSDLVSCFEKFAELTNKRIIHLQRGIESENGKKIISTSL